MLKHLYLVACLLLTCLYASGQTPAGFVPAPFNHANTVLVQTPDSANEALLKMGKLLVAQGYTIRRLDRDFGTLTTEPRRTDRKAIPTSISVKAQAGPGGLLLTAELLADVSVLIAGSENTVVRVQQLGKQPSGYFLQLQQLAAEYGAPLAYGQSK